MKSKSIVEIILHPELGAKLCFYEDEDGLWAELYNGEETVEAPTLFKPLDQLRHAIILKEEDLRAAETPKVTADA